MKISKDKKSGWIILVALALMLSIVLVATAINPYDTEQTRPIQLGVSGGNINDIKRPYCFGGTLGSLVQDASGNQYILSNNHVLARENKAPIGEDIIQPGLIDQGCYKDANDVVADLTAFKPFLFKGTNYVDAAIAKVRVNKVDTSGFILGIGTVNKDIISDPVVGMGVKKSGRTTGLTKGSISAVHVTVSVKYSTRTAKFADQILITPGVFSDGGDSGSLIVEDVDSNPRPVGLLFAGSSTSTVANPISYVLSSFDVSMVGVSTLPSTSLTTSSSEGMTMTTQSQLPTKANNKAIENAKNVKERHENALFNIEGVVGTGIGLSGTDPDKVVIEVYVKKSAHEMKRMIPEVLEDIPVEIVETGEFVAR
ncbi:MAG: hypothetical protein WA144_00780 [Candidatus Methanoperedens sp.]